MDAVSVIRAKRDGRVLTDAQIDWVIDAYVRGVVAEEQMAALAMAILLRGMTSAETARWTGAMLASGERLALGALARPTVDKHSTGGVGDKITLPGRRCRSCPVEGSGTPAGRWTSWRRSPVGALH
jgi:thymidine phosphorylase